MTRLIESEIAGQEMPAIRCLRMAVILHVNGFFRRRLLRRFARIEADRDHIVILARRERQDFGRPHHAIQDLRAQHRAVVIDQRQHHGTLAEVLAQLHRIAVFVPERRVERQLRIQPLLDGHAREREGRSPPFMFRRSPAPAERAARSSSGPRSSACASSAVCREQKQHRLTAATYYLDMATASSLRNLFQRPPAAGILRNRPIAVVSSPVGLGFDGKPFCATMSIACVDRNPHDAFVGIDPAIAVQNRVFVRRADPSVRFSARPANRGSGGNFGLSLIIAAAALLAFFASSRLNRKSNIAHIANTTTMQPSSSPMPNAVI